MKLQSMDSSSPEELSLAVKSIGLKAVRYNVPLNEFLLGAVESIGLKAVRYCFGDIIFATNSVEV